VFDATVLCRAVAVQVSQAEVLIEERDEEIRKIVETIAELAQIMRDLSTLVVEQGTMLDRIDSNITQAAVKVSCPGCSAAIRVARAYLSQQLTRMLMAVPVHQQVKYEAAPEAGSNVWDIVCSRSSCAL
jgi:t-SNARE complex subunit (syntaxin)